MILPSTIWRMEHSGRNGRHTLMMLLKPTHTRAPVRPDQQEVGDRYNTPPHNLRKRKLW